MTFEAKSPTDTQSIEGGLLASLLSDDNFWPAEPQTIEETGLSSTYLEALICKYLAANGTSSGRAIAENVCLPFGILEGLFASLRQRQIVVHSGSAPFNDYYYVLTQQGRADALNYMEASAYIGPAPVPLMDYVVSVDAQTLAAEAPGREQLEKALAGISVEPAMFDVLGPAVNSGAGMFLYGEPGNGKSTLARCITNCFGNDIWIPHALFDDGQLINLFDPAFHSEVGSQGSALIKSADHDRRWIKIRRPTVVVGGELTMDNLEIRHDPKTNVSEAPLQLKSNCGCLLIDDFGRQRINPTELLNRWIIPLENRYDFLTLGTGKKIQVPFEQLVIFSTNLEPADLVDEAFLRRIPYKIEIGAPSESEFRKIFDLFARSLDCPLRAEAIDHLLAEHYKKPGRPLRRCHPRDLLLQVRNYCRYHGLPLEMRNEYFDRAARTYFTAILNQD